LPDVPTTAESGIAGIEAPSWFCFLAAAGTPREVIARLNTEINRTRRDRDMVARMAEPGLETTGGTPEQLAQAMRADHARYAKVIGGTGIALE
jgi:tripartite-type tricarboxylate transporter receptor subunit TctC